MDFAPKETHLALQRMANDFSRQDVLPKSEEIDRNKDPERRFPEVLLEKGSRLGLRTLAVPENLGGGGADLLTLCIVGEELGWGDLGVGATFAQDWSVSFALNAICEEARLAEFNASFVADHGAHLTRAEFGFGSSFECRMPYDGEKETQPASAVKDGKGWNLRGLAAHVMNGAVARHVLLSFDSSLNEDRQAFLVDGPASSNLHVARYFDSMGMRSCQDVSLVCDDLMVSEKCRIPCEPGDWRRVIPAFCVLPSSVALGTARRSNEQATVHARERVQGGKPIIGHQTVGFMLCDNLMELEAARRTLHALSWEAGQENLSSLRRCYLMKVFVSEACERIARRSMEVWGGAGYMTEAPMERLVRDMTSFMHAGEMVASLRVRAMSMI